MTQRWLNDLRLRLEIAEREFQAADFIDSTDRRARERGDFAVTIQTLKTQIEAGERELA
jgi:hypothetical protein